MNFLLRRKEIYEPVGFALKMSLCNAEDAKPHRRKQPKRGNLVLFFLHLVLFCSFGLHR